ncbi:hypothetical protein AYI74_17015 [Shewanella algae]|uniref:S24 family peptidase n=1 Tax=Shewanella algae TaxID=38313 RepID=UPI0005EC25CA|nr:S24 family peptidase [Shewanella algae]MBO2576191.1 helix-turn-helix transcriptional regulator [Shewanella algae]MBO2631143.1 helix-turn-helix transcriptional regulator [Shewanella algae]MBO2635289.1 helix-turn-helix transcriptional regulator [Shewanella algae]MBO2681756.1 helix-turn-helix transcriptional regulator [Shewanella algae]MDC8855972.1 S24 family peptidase [Shewanella algae]
MLNKEDVLNRIEELVGNRTLRKASEDWGIAPATLSTMLKERREPRFENLTKIATAEGITMEQLLLGKDVVARDDFVTIPALNVSASAGNGSYVLHETEANGIKVNKRWLHDEGLCHKDLVIINSHGDSMVPTIPEGASIIVDTKDNSYKREGVYAIRNGDELSVKRLRFDSFNNELHIISDNSVYPLWTVRKEQLGEVSVIGRVVKLLVNL